MAYFTVGGHYDNGVVCGFSLLLDANDHTPFVDISASQLFREHRQFSHVYRLSEDLRTAYRVIASEKAESIGIKAPKRARVNKESLRLLRCQIMLLEAKL